MQLRNLMSSMPCMHRATLITHMESVIRMHHKLHCTRLCCNNDNKAEVKSGRLTSGAGHYRPEMVRVLTAAGQSYQQAATMRTFSW